MLKIEIRRGGESKAVEASLGGNWRVWWQEGRRLLADCCWAGLETMSEKLQDGRRVDYSRADWLPWRGRAEPAFPQPPGHVRSGDVIGT